MGVDKCEWKSETRFSACEKLANELREDLFAATDGSYGNFCKWCGADIRKPSPKVIIKKNGGTFAAFYDGVDYVWTLEDTFHGVPALFYVNGINSIIDGWKRIDEIESEGITDEIAKLNPKVTGGWRLELVIYGNAICSKKKGNELVVKPLDLKDIHLATVAELLEESEEVPSLPVPPTPPKCRELKDGEII